MEARDLGELHGVRVRVVATSEPWRVVPGALVVPAGPVQGFGVLGDALRLAFPGAGWDALDLTTLSSGEPLVVPLARNDERGSREAIVVTAHEARSSTASAGDGPATLDGVRRATSRALEAAADQGAGTVGLPLLGSGVVGLPAGDVAATMVPAVERALRAMPGSRRPEEILFVDRSPRARRAIERAWEYHELLRHARETALRDESLRRDAAAAGIPDDRLAEALDQPDEEVWKACATEFAVLRRMDEEQSNTLSETGLDRPRRRRARDGLVRVLVDTVMGPRLRLLVTQRQHERARADAAEFQRPLTRTDTARLRLPAEKDMVIRTAAGSELSHLLDTSQSVRMSVGVAGPRGCGKSTLLRDAYEGWNTHGIRIFLPAPASYLPREFLVHLYAKVCAEVLKRDPAVPWSDDSRPVRPAALRSATLLHLVLLPLVALIGGIGLLVVAAVSIRAENGAGYAAFGAAVIVASGVPLVLSWIPEAWARRWALPGAGRILLTTAACGALGLLAPHGLLSGQQLTGVVLVAAGAGTSLWWPRPRREEELPDGAEGRLAAAGRALVLLAAATVQACALIAGVALIVLPEAVAAPAPAALAGAALTAVGCATLWAGARWRALVTHSAERRDALPANRFSRRALRDLARIRYQTTIVSGWTNTLKMSGPKWLPFSADSGVSGSSSEADLPLGIPDIVEGIKALLPCRGPALVVIDELDKIESVDKARDFLNEIKGILDAEDCYFLLSMSEDAIGSFERRGLPFRDVFDSAFDEVVRMPYLSAADSFALLGGRLTDVPPQFYALAHCQAAGLPRDLLRAAGRMLSLPPENDANAPSLAAVAHQVVHRDLRSRTEAVTAAIKSIALEPDVSAILRIVRRLDTCDSYEPRRCILDPDWLDGAIHLSPVLQAAMDDIPQRRDLLRLTIELLGYAYYSRTLLELFRADTDAEVGTLMAAVNDAGRQVLDRLAQVQQSFMVNPFLAWAFLSEVRQELSLAAFPLPKSLVVGGAAAQAAPADRLPIELAVPDAGQEDRPLG